jgi:transglutaminase-like putative cysteine protease
VSLRAADAASSYDYLGGLLCRAAGAFGKCRFRQPPPGKSQLLGADAMHAWVSIFMLEVGWVDYDPANTCFTSNGHFVVVRGRDYADVSPTRGVISGGGIHRLKIGMTVDPEGESKCG